MNAVLRMTPVPKCFPIKNNKLGMRMACILRAAVGNPAAVTETMNMTPTAAKRVVLEDSAKTEAVGGDACPSSCGASEKIAIISLVSTFLQERGASEGKAGSWLKQKTEKEEYVSSADKVAVCEADQGEYLTGRGKFGHIQSRCWELIGTLATWAGARCCIKGRNPLEKQLHLPLGGLQTACYFNPSALDGLSLDSSPPRVASPSSSSLSEPIGIKPTSSSASVVVDGELLFVFNSAT